MPGTTTSDPARQSIDNFLAIPLPAPGDPLAQQKLLHFGWACVAFAETWRRGAPAEFARIRGHMARIHAAARAAGVQIPARWLELVPEGGTPAAAAGELAFVVEPPAEMSLAPVPAAAPGGQPTDPVLKCKVRCGEPGPVVLQVL